MWSVRGEGREAQGIVCPLVSNLDVRGGHEYCANIDDVKSALKLFISSSYSYHRRAFKAGCM